MTAQLSVKPRDPGAVLREQSAEIRAAMATAIESDVWSDGALTRRFEATFAHWLGVSHAVGTGSGPAALQMALATVSVGQGTVVVVDGLVDGGVLAVIARLGARAVAVDVDPGTLTMDPEQLAAALGTKGAAAGARAVLVTHRFGHPADMDALGEVCAAKGVRLVEDATQALGALMRGRRVGSLGDVAAFDLAPDWGQGGIGPAGMITTADTTLAERARLLSGLGTGAWEEPGLDCPMGEVAAAVLGALLPLWDSAILRRQAIGLRYDTALPPLGITPPVERGWATHAYTAYPVRPADPQGLRAALLAVGVDCGWTPNPALLSRPDWIAALPECQAAVDGVLLLPLYPQMPADTLQLVLATLAQASSC